MISTVTTTTITVTTGQVLSYSLLAILIIVGIIWFYKRKNQKVE